jgi:hypothetical protein
VGMSDDTDERRGGVIVDDEHGMDLGRGVCV